MNYAPKLTTAILVCWSCSAGAGDASSDLDAGARHLAPFKQALQQALLEGLAEGPLAAIDSCRVRAPEIADSLARDGIRLGRSSNKLRNPANAGPDWVRPILEDYLAAAGERAARTSALPGNRIGYAEPILVRPLCLTCHGSPIAADVGEELRALYPDDQATGYSAGDLRGVFWVEFPAEH